MAAFPTLDAYLTQLPNGLDSFPDCTIKASVMRDALASRAVRDDPALPAPVRSFLQSPPPVTARIPEALSNALLTTLYDEHFRAAGRRAAYQWMRESTTSLLRKPIYRILFAVLSPERLLSGSAQRWHAFRQGTELVVAAQRSGFARLKLTFPPSLHSELTLYLLAAAAHAAIDVAGARDSSVDVSSSAGEALFDCTWNPG